MMDVNCSNFEFLTEIIENEPDEKLKAKLITIQQETMDAERQAAINQKTNYRTCIVGCGIACDTISHLFVMKKYPNRWVDLHIDEEGKDRIPSMNKIWKSKFYANEWEKNERDLELYIELFHLKGEYNYAHHDGKPVYSYPKIIIDPYGNKIIDRNERRGVVRTLGHKKLSDEDVIVILGQENALKRLRHTFAFLCAVIEKCGYTAKDELPKYKEPARITAVHDETLESINGAVSDLNVMASELKETFNKSSVLIESVEKSSEYFKDNAELMASMLYSSKNKDSSESGRTSENKEKIGTSSQADSGGKMKERKKLIFLTVVAVLLIIILAAVIAVGRMKNTDTEAKYTSSSKIIPYNEAGRYESYNSYNSTAESIDAEKAVAVLSFIKNKSPETAVVEDIRCVFEEIEEIHEPVIKTDVALSDNVLKVYVVNDGSDISDELSVKLEGSRESISDYVSGSIINEIGKMNPGDIKEAAEYTLDQSKFIDNNMEDMQVSITVNGVESSVVTILYDPIDDKFILSGGKGDPGADVTLFSILDVDAKPTSISFTTDEIATIDDAIRIETVIAPTKSCKIRIKGEYIIDGEIMDTEVFTATVLVPYYADEAFGYQGAMTLKLASDPNNSNAHIKQIAQEYLYDPESINPGK